MGRHGRAAAGGVAGLRRAARPSAPRHCRRSSTGRWPTCSARPRARRPWTASTSCSRSRSRSWCRSPRCGRPAASSPDAVVGHSQGEIAAAAVAGRAVPGGRRARGALRSQAIADVLAGDGGMMSVPLPVAEVEEHLRARGDDLSIAAVNGPRSVVVSGAARAPGRAAGPSSSPRTYAPSGSRSTTPRTPRRSSGCSDELRTALAPLRPRPARVPFYSTVTGEPLDTTQLDAGYWYRNLRQTVRFDPTIRDAPRHRTPRVRRGQPPPGADRGDPGGDRGDRRHGRGRRHAAARPGRHRPVPDLARRGVRPRSAGGLVPGVRPGPAGSRCPPTRSSASGSGPSRRPRGRTPAPGRRTRSSGPPSNSRTPRPWPPACGSTRRR